MTSELPASIREMIDAERAKRDAAEEARQMEKKETLAKRRSSMLRSMEHYLGEMAPFAGFPSDHALLHDTYLNVVVRLPGLCPLQTSFARDLLRRAGRRSDRVNGSARGVSRP